MEIAYDDHLLARILLTLATIGYSAIPVKADFNATHATNPLWTGHARFHVVWQNMTNCGMAIIALGLIWIAGPLATERLYLAAALGVTVLGGFYVTAVVRHRFAGTFHDTNGYPGFTPPFAPAHWHWDLNMTIFTAISVVLLAGAATI